MEYENRGSRGWWIINEDGTETKGVFANGEVLPATVTEPTVVEATDDSAPQPKKRPRKRKE